MPLVVLLRARVKLLECVTVPAISELGHYSIKDRETTMMVSVWLPSEDMAPDRDAGVSDGRGGCGALSAMIPLP